MALKKHVYTFATTLAKEWLASHQSDFPCPSNRKGWLVSSMYVLSFVWEKADFDFEDDYCQLCDEAKLPYDFTYQPRINEDSPHIG